MRLFLYVLNHNVDRRADDQAHAAILVRALESLPGLSVMTPKTGLVYPSGAGLTADELARRLVEQGVLVSGLDGQIRACTHLDVSLDSVNMAAEAFNAVLG